MFTNNKVTQLLGIQYPIIEGGMAHIGDGQLAAAVTNAGGLGQVAVSGFSPKKFQEEINIATSLTKGSLGVNIPISNFFNTKDYFSVIEQEKDKIKAVSLSSGDPRPHIPVLKEMGFRVLVVVGSVQHALKAEEAGADIVICEGFEAGGRNSPLELTLFSLIPAIEDKLSIPVVAAGGISSGKGILGALALGAEGVQIGTRFIATIESRAHDSYKQELVLSNEESTTVVERSIGGINRVIKSEFVEKIKQVEEDQSSFQELYPYINGQRNRMAAIDGILSEGWVHAGQGTALISNVDTTKNVIDEMVQKTVEAFEQMEEKMKAITNK
ncbi:NAD(P)H-dependent flavin oxidoreductase [Bacillus sp. FJAT-44742]|uniref:NAD(P)H-dependent flavin oxidoreductase n=1 Tax=Bacillus sp. FJAT-44742 TaxID=2014005 RepID=UPI000C250FC3|nr:nitronate monooxygenase [Bacillus sp. FJAT-44742]